MLQFFKKALRYIITAGAGTIISSIAADATQDKDQIAKICAGAASWAIGAYIGEKTADYMDEYIDEIEKKVKAARIAKGGDE